MTPRGRLGCLFVLAYPIVEIAIAVAVAQVIGWWWLLVVVVACIVLGLGLVRYSLGATGRSFGMAIASLQGPGESGIVAIVAWERPGLSALTRLWSTARSTTAPISTSRGCTTR